MRVVEDEDGEYSVLLLESEVCTYCTVDRVQSLKCLVRRSERSGEEVDRLN